MPNMKPDCDGKNDTCIAKVKVVDNKKERVSKPQVRIHVRVMSLFMDDLIIMCVPRTCTASYPFI